ncbi:MAG: hypothetical protein ACR2NZ_13655 [Rubripirellula sp.]
MYRFDVTHPGDAFPMLPQTAFTPTAKDPSNARVPQQRDSVVFRIVSRWARNQSLRSLLGLLGLVAFTGGCLPERQAPTIEGPISGNVATQLQSTVRSDRGNKYTVSHDYQGQQFDANWELSNALKRSAQLQIKPPASWSLDDVHAAMRVVLADHKSSPWYAQIDETVLKLIDEAANNDSERAVGIAPDTPYEIAVKVKQYTQDWFVEVKVKITYADGTSIGF